MSIKLVSTGGGSVTIQEPNTASDFTLSVPSRTGNVAVDGPAFRASMSSNQSYSSNTYTKVQFNTESFDTASCYDTATYRFTPNVAGYYQIGGRIDTSAGTYVETDIYKNGSRLSFSQINGTFGTVVSDLVYMNGTTDYIELYAFITTSGTITSGISSNFYGSMVRAA